MALRDQWLQILERLDELSSGIRGQTMGIDMDHPLVVSLAMADKVAISTDALQALFNALWEALVPLSPTIRWE